MMPTCSAIYSEPPDDDGFDEDDWDAPPWSDQEPEEDDLEDIGQEDSND